MLELIAGVDEVGRGPLAGPVVAAAVVLDVKRPVPGLADSKKLSAAKRVDFAEVIKRKALFWAIGSAEVAEIDRLNILSATLLAMQRAVAGLRILPGRAMIDGNRLPELPCPAEPIIKGDQTVACISAASILAKVYRDALMATLDRRYPEYGFAIHKGYGTRHHLQALLQFGPSPIHRQSFAPVRESRSALARSHTPSALARSHTPRS